MYVQLEIVLRLIKFYEEGSLEQNLLELYNSWPCFIEPPFLVKFNRIIRQEYGNSEFNNHALSQKLCLCRIQVNRKISKFSHLSAGKYLLRFRLIRAIELLIKTDDSIKQISNAIGFENQSNFTRSFKREFGFRPKEIRGVLFEKLQFE